MDSSGHMILPKGFVVNSEDIYKEVASYPVVPPEKIREYWGVYTTTFRRLIDPTANRLENFWWHVWGSDRKHLSGKTLALIFEEISTGPTIAPLPGPPNRWEPPVFGERPPPWKTNKTSDESSASESKSSDSSAKNGTAKPQPHPILKKARVDSKSGPRPTARFAEEDGDASSGSASPAGVEMRRTSSEMRRERKKGPAPKKQFHASVGAKRRPALPRRISSQSSASPDTAGKEEGARGAKQGQRRSTEEAGPAAVVSEKPPSSKMVGKRLAVRPGLERRISHEAAGKRAAGRPGLERRISHEASRKAAGNQRSGPVPHTRSLEDVRRQHPGIPQGGSDGSNGLNAGKIEPMQAAQAPDTDPKPRPSVPRSQTLAEPRRPEPSPVKAARPALAAEPTASTTTVAAQGTIIDFDRPPPQPPMATVPEAEDISLPRQPSATSLLESRLAPTQPSAAPAVPLGRTRSQLTLLLERERERLGESRG